MWHMYLATFKKVTLKSEVWETLFNVSNSLILQINWGLVVKSSARGHLLAYEKNWTPLSQDNVLSPLTGHSFVLWNQLAECKVLYYLKSMNWIQPENILVTFPQIRLVDTDGQFETQ